MKPPKIAKIELYARFVHVVAPEDGKPSAVQVVTEDGRLITIRTNQTIWKRVLGTRRGEKGERFHLGLRQLTRVQFRAHFDDQDVCQAIDIVPNKMFVSGAAPKASGDAIKKGFDIHWDEELNGFDIWSEDGEGNKLRIGYAGLSDRRLYELLGELRKASWGNKKTLTLLEHRFEKVEEGLIRCRPLEEKHYTT